MNTNCFELDEVFHCQVEISARRHAKRIFRLSEAFAAVIESNSDRLDEKQLAKVADEAVRRCERDYLDVSDLPEWFYRNFEPNQNTAVTI